MGGTPSVGRQVVRCRFVVREHNGDWWYVVGPGLDEPLLAVKRGFSGMANVTQLWLPVVSDDRGQLIAIADSGGQLQGPLIGPSYDAGLWNSSGLTSHAQSFNPRHWATPSGIDTISTFRSRQYDPATGKWLQEDPMGVAGGVNLYGYNGNDPNSFGDPFGLEPDPCKGVLSCVAAIAKMEARGVLAGMDLTRTGVSANEGGAGFILGRIAAAAIPEGGAEAAVAGEAGGGAELGFSAHQAVENVGRGITQPMAATAVRMGQKFADAKWPGTVAHVVSGGMASGKDLYVVTDATSTKVVTAMVRRFNPATTLNGTLRWTPHQ
jgi:RHS repeat-associated protein